MCRGEMYHWNGSLGILIGALLALFMMLLGRILR